MGNNLLLFTFSKIVTGYLYTFFFQIKDLESLHIPVHVHIYSLKKII